MKLSELHITSVVQPRGGDIDSETVSTYAAAVGAGDVFPPLIAFNITDRRFPGPILVAGFHRHAAYKKAGVGSAEVDLRTGTFSEAWLAGYQSNLTHGLRYTNQQKRNAVEVALKMFKSDSANSIADRLSVSHTLVQKIRDELVKAKEIDAPEKVVRTDGRTEAAKKTCVATVATQTPPKHETTTTTSTRQAETVKRVEPVDDDPDDDEDEAEAFEDSNSEIDDYDKSEFNDQISLICREIESTQRLVHDLADNYPKSEVLIKSSSAYLKAALDQLWALRE